MSDYPKGLRFDIYERLTLSDDVAGIGELEDIELIPRITMQTHQDQAVLSGDLLLMGTYVGVDTRNEVSDIKQLSHRIPVEITLPLKRIKRMDSIGIEIENFDVELISARSLNITGVISLNGIDTAAEQAWQQQGEAVFVQEAGQVSAEQELSETSREEVLASDDHGQRSQNLDVDDSVRERQAEEQIDASIRRSEEEARSWQTVVGSADDGVRQMADSPTGWIANVDSNQKSGSTVPSDHDVAEELIANAEASTIDTRQQRVEPNAEVQPESKPEKQPPTMIPKPKAEEKIDDKAPSKVEDDDLPEANLEPQAKPDAKSNIAPGVQSEPSVDLKSTEQALTDVQSDMSEDMEANLKPLEDQLEQEAAYQDNSSPELDEAVEGMSDKDDKDQPKGMKIAFGSNKQSDDWHGTAAGVKSLLSKQEEESRQPEYPAVQETEADTDESEPRATEDTVRWKNLLLSAEKEEQRFSKMRICIVQKEETLDTIASRYSLNPKEIVLYNRLESEYVQEGQVIYIPS